MYISQMAAQSIVDEIGREICENVNIMDSRGYIIASTDPARIGGLHEGARKIIQERLGELYITSEMETASTRKGINLPIMIHGEIVGVVGISGEKEQVAGYGNIVRRMTEIMVNDSMQKDRHRYDRRVRYRFLEEWIARAGMVWDRNFVERGLRLGIDIERPRRVLAIHFERYQELSDTQEGQQHLETMEASVRHFTDQEKNNLYLREPTKQLCFINACPDQKMQEIGEQLIELIRGKYGERIVIGIDSERSWKDGGHIGRLCEEAEKAAEYCEENGRDIMFYKELSVELFLDEISAGTMKKYLDKLFPVEEEELGYFMTIVSVYFQVDGSITRMAEVLFMHKNTIQYKLKKLEALSGKDIRTPQGASVYYMALAFYKKLYGESRLVRCV